MPSGASTPSGPNRDGDGQRQDKGPHLQALCDAPRQVAQTGQAAQDNNQGVEHPSCDPAEPGTRLTPQGSAGISSSGHRASHAQTRVVALTQQAPGRQSLLARPMLHSDWRTTTPNGQASNGSPPSSGRTRAAKI